MKLIVGLGNPGKQYENTRHNAGFRFIDAYANAKGIKIEKEKFSGLYANYIYNEEKVILLKPQKFMNLSGEVIKKYIDFYKIPMQNIFIIYDDLDTKVGQFKLRYQGSSAGHNGLKNIENNIQTSNYNRLKIGIGKSTNINSVDYVIGKIPTDELKQINKVNEIAENIIDDYLSMSFDNLMNKYNTKG